MLLRGNEGISDKESLSFFITTIVMYCDWDSLPGDHIVDTELDVWKMIAQTEMKIWRLRFCIRGKT